MREDLRSKLKEDNTRDRLFHPHMKLLGYPSADQAGATQYDQQVNVATGIFDGCYLYDGRPMVLVELKREHLLSSDTELEKTRKQVHDYALADDFEVPPPFFLISDGHVFEMHERTSLDPKAPLYQPLPRIYRWDEVREWEPGRYTSRFVSLRELIRLFRDYVGVIEAEIQPQVLRLTEAAERGHDSVTVKGRRYGKADIGAVADLLNSKLAASTLEDAARRRTQAVRELVAAAAMNYVNKVFFLKYCEDRHLPGLFRIIGEIELDPVSTPKTAAYAGAFASILKRRALVAQTWDDAMEHEYRKLIGEIKRSVLDRRSWFELLHAAFLAAEQSFPVIYRPTPYDTLCPDDETIVNMICELRQADFSSLDHEMVGSIYQGILQNEQSRQKVLGAFYTPPKTVDYMVSRLNLNRDDVTLEPACGSGHFVESLFRAYVRRWTEQGYEEHEAVHEIVEKHLVAFDIDNFAAQLAAMRLFFLLEKPIDIVPNIFVRDTLDMNVGAAQGSFMDAAGHTIFDELGKIDPRAKLSHAADLDEIRFDRIVGNPPYGGKPTPERAAAYKRLYRDPPGLYNEPLGSNDTFGYFIANSIHRAKEGAIICLIVSDSMLSIDTHKQLRRLIMSTCKIRELLLAPVDLFHPVAIPRTCIITLEKANGSSNAEARRANKMRLVGRLESEDQYSDPPLHLVETRLQSDYETVPRNPFFMHVHSDILSLFTKFPDGIGKFLEGGAGLQTGNNPRYVALLEGSSEANEQTAKSNERLANGRPPLVRIYRVVPRAEIVDFGRQGIPESQHGFPDYEPHFVPFVRGSSRHQYYAEPDRYVDYGATAVEAYKTSGSSRYENVNFYFQRGLVTNAHNRMLRSTLAELCVPAVNTNLFVPTGYSVEYFLGLLNSRLATYLCTKILNTSIGGLSAHPTPEDIRLIPFAPPTAEQQAGVENAVSNIIAARRTDAAADISVWQAAVDDTVSRIYGLTKGAVTAVDIYWQEVLAEQVGPADDPENGE